VIKSKDITGLRSHFPKNSTTWSNIATRFNSFSASANYGQHLRKLNQNIYGFVLSQDKLMISTIKSNFKTAARKKTYTIQSTTTPVTKGLNRKSRSKTTAIKESSAENALEFPVIPKSILDSTDIQYFDSRIATKKSEPVDLGSVIKYKIKVSTEYDPIKLGSDISKFINFINPHPAKLETIVKQFLTAGLEDSSFSVHNMAHKNSAYFAFPEFWTPLLLKCCIDVAVLQKSKEVAFDSGIDFYRRLLLIRLDPEKAKNLQATYPDKRIDVVYRLNKSIEKLLQSERLSVSDKMYLLASLDMPTVLKFLPGITSQLRAFFQANFDDGIELLAGVGTLLPADKLIELVLAVAPVVLNIPRIIHSLHYSQLGKAPSEFSSLLLQLLGSKLNKTHYVPYGSIQQIKHGIFAPMLVSKLFGYFLTYKTNDIIAFIETQKQKVLTSFSSKIRVGIHFPKIDAPVDKQIFVHVRPFMDYTLVDDTNESDMILIGEAKRESVMSVIDNHVMIFDPMKNIEF
jgi:hypothetical protein